MAWIELLVGKTREPTWINLDQVRTIIFVNPVLDVIPPPGAAVVCISGLPYNGNTGQSDLVTTDPNDLQKLRDYVKKNEFKSV